jgi:hypothetical protein
MPATHHLIFLIWALCARSIRPDSVIETESIEFNWKTLRPNTVIYQVKQSDSFQPPYYVIPIMPSQLTPDLNVNLNTGEIYFHNVPEADQFKFSVLSIMHGTAKMLSIHFVDDDLVQTTVTTTTTETTTSTMPGKTHNLNTKKLKSILLLFFLISS